MLEQHRYRFSFTLVADTVPDFEEWVAKKKFKNPKTKQDIGFHTLEKLNPDKAKKIRDQFNKKVQEQEGQDESDPIVIKRMWGESQEAWTERVEQNDAEIKAYRETEFDRVLGPKIQDALNKTLTKKENEAIDLDGPLEKMEPANVQILKRTLDKALKKYKPETVAKYDELFDLDPPHKVLDAKMAKAKENEAKVKDLMKKAEGLEGEEGNKLVQEAKTLMDEMEKIDAEVTEGLKYLKENKDLSTIKEHHAGLINEVWSRHDKAKNKPDKDTPQGDQKPEDKSEDKDEKPKERTIQDRIDEVDDLIQKMIDEARADTGLPEWAGGKKKKPKKEEPKPKTDMDRKVDTLVEEIMQTGEKNKGENQKKLKDLLDSIKNKGKSEPEPEEEEAKEEDPEHKAGDVWGKKPKLYSMNPKGEQGGPFKSMNQAKRWSKGEDENPEKKEKTRKEQQKAKRRKKRGMVDVLAFEWIGNSLFSY